MRHTDESRSAGPGILAGARGRGRSGTEEEFERSLSEREPRWGTKTLASEYLGDNFAPSLANDEQTVAWLADYMRNAASPGAANAFSRMNHAIDVRSALPAIHVPTLVLARDGDRVFPMEETKWIADRIRGRSVRLVWRRRREPNVCVRCGHIAREHHRGRVDFTGELVRADEDNCWSCPPYESRTWHAFARPKYEAKLIDRIRRDSSDDA